MRTGGRSIGVHRHTSRLRRTNCVNRSSRRSASAPRS
jgi:hypothetical protein